MSSLQHFTSCAAAFEKALESDDRAPLDPHFTGDAVYGADGVWDIGFELEAFATFRDGCICAMEHRHDAATVERVQAWVREHGAKLGIEQA